jgi:hypothetical protein
MINLLIRDFTALLVVISLAAFAAAQSGVYIEYMRQGGVRCRSNCRAGVRPWNDCPVVNCPPAVRDGLCGEPDCSLAGNRLRLHPARDPNWFYQCVPLDGWGRIGPQLRPCGKLKEC